MRVQQHVSSDIKIYIQMCLYSKRTVKNRTVCACCCTIYLILTELLLTANNSIRYQQNEQLRWSQGQTPVKSKVFALFV